MTDSQWQRALELYDRVARLPADAARELLESLEAPEDRAVVQEVSAMLASLNDAAPDDESDAAAAQTRYAGCSIGRYEVTHLIGSGSSGDVYAGLDRDLGRPVALKFMSRESGGAAVAAERFVREARAASALNHPNIVVVHEVITWNALPVIVMEMIEGHALRSLCGSPMPIEQAIRVGTQILHALAAAHAAGIVHRDLKPENVMVRPDGLVKILDLGLARRTIVDGGRQNLSSAGLPVGTLRYMSPETCRGERAVAASDVFAAGIVLYEMLAGRHPFDADSPLDTAHGIVWSAAQPVEQLRPDVPPWLGALVARMLSKEMEARPTATAAAEALITGSIAKLPQAATRVRRGTRLWVVALAVLAMIVFFAGLWSKGTLRRTSGSSDFQIAPLANWLGAERQPSISADGSRVAFAFRGEKDPTSHIYVKNVSDTGSVRLTSDVLPDFRPAFSPDGTRLAFLRKAGGHLRIIVMPSSGGVERQAGEAADLLREYGMMTWAPDGQHLLLSDRVSKLRPEVALFRISVTDGARQQITFPPAGASDWMPAISPDGQKLGYARVVENGRGDIWAMPVEGGPAQRLTNSNDVFFCWAWGGDGRDLLISYRVSGRSYLWRKPVNGGTAIRVAGLDDQVKEISIARKNVLVYGSRTEDDFNVWRYAAPPSTEAPKAIIASAAYDGDARYSPDGLRIAFASTRSGQSNIWVCASDGSEPRQMTSLESSGFTAGSPSWSPDGRWIAFDARSAKSASSIFVIDARGDAIGAKPRRLTGPGPTDFIPTWSRDGRWVYFSSDRGGGPLQIWKVAAAGGTAVQVTRNAGFESFESPDGRYLYYTKGGRSNGFWRMPLAGGEETFVSELARVGNRYWESSLQGVYFVAPSPGPALELYHFSDGHVSRVTDLPVQPASVGRGLSVSFDGRSFLYMQGDVATSNLMVVSNFN